MLAAAHPGARIGQQGLVEVAFRGLGVGQADVGSDRVVAVADAGEQHGRLAVVLRRLGVGVLVQVHAAEVQADPASGGQVAQGTQFGLRGFGTAGRLCMLAQQGQRHDLGHLGLSRRVGQPGAPERGSGGIEAVHGLLHLALGQTRNARRPFNQRQ